MNAAELFFNIIDYNLLLEVASSRKISINGFKSLRKAPEFILRKNISLKFAQNFLSFKSILEDFYGSKLNELKKETVEDFIYSFLSYPLKDTISNHAALGMLVLSFPEYSETMVDKFYENIKNNQHIFYRCVEPPKITNDNCYFSISKLLQLSDEIECIDLLISKIENILVRIRRKEEYKNLCKELKGLNFYDFAIRVNDLRKVLPDYLPLLAFIKNNTSEVKKSEGEIRNFYKKLIFKIYDCVAFEVFNEFENEIQESYIETRALKEANRQYEKKLSIFENEYKIIDDKAKEYQEKIKYLLNFYEGQVTEFKEQEAADIDVNYESLIITSYSYDRIFDSIGSYSILSPENINLLGEILNEFKGMVFIDRNCIETTRELIKIEKLIKLKGNNKVVLWSKCVEELVKNIIITKCKLEG